MLPSNSSSAFVIAISGASGVGKTTLAQKVADMLGDAVVLRFDDYQPVATWPADLAKWAEEGKQLDAWEIPQLLDDLKALRNRQAISLPAGQGEVKPAKFVVLEEPSGRVRAGLREVVDFVVLVEVPLEIALARKVVEYLSFCLKELPPEKLPEAMQGLIKYYSQYALHREYYLTLIERVRQDCQLVLDGTQTIDELASEVLDALNLVIE
jgi:uridine kinase